MGRTDQSEKTSYKNNNNNNKGIKKQRNKTKKSQTTKKSNTLPKKKRGGGNEKKKKKEKRKKENSPNFTITQQTIHTKPKEHSNNRKQNPTTRSNGSTEERKLPRLRSWKD